MYFISDWALLNDTNSKQLERILAEFHHLSEAEIHLACILLESYHAVYRRDRLEQRRNLLKLGQARIPGGCLPPTAIQLHEIAGRVNAKAALRLEAEDILMQLQELTKRLRQYRLYLRKSLKQTTPPQEKHNLPICDSEVLRHSPYSPVGILGQAFPQGRSVDHIQLPNFMRNWENQNEPAQLFVLNYTNRSCSRYELSQSRKNGRCCGR